MKNTFARNVRMGVIGSVAATMLYAVSQAAAGMPAFGPSPEVRALGCGSAKNPCRLEQVVVAVSPAQAPHAKPRVRLAASAAGTDSAVRPHQSGS